jgi:hypothetical protein
VRRVQGLARERYKEREKEREREREKERREKEERERKRERKERERGVRTLIASELALDSACFGSCSSQKGTRVLRWYLAHAKQPLPLGPPLGPRHIPSVGRQQLAQLTSAAAHHRREHECYGTRNILVQRPGFRV